MRQNRIIFVLKLKCSLIRESISFFRDKVKCWQIAINALSDVWRYFIEGGAEYESTFSIDFEHYVNGNHIDAYIAIK